MSFRFHLIMVIKFYLVLAFLLKCHGGDEEIRSPDPLLARQVLSQLSYTPVSPGLNLLLEIPLCLQGSFPHRLKSP